MAKPRTRIGNYTNYSFWLDRNLRIKLETLAEKNQTTLPRLIEKILIEYTKKEGF